MSTSSFKTRDMIRNNMREVRTGIEGEVGTGRDTDSKVLVLQNTVHVEETRVLDIRVKDL